MNRIASVMVMHARDRMTWLLGPWIVLGIAFVICLLIALTIDLLWGDATPVYTGALASIYVVMVGEGIGTVVGTFPFAVGFGTRRRDYLLGTLAWGLGFCAGWVTLLGLLSLIEANVIKNWGVGLHFFHLPFFSDGSPLRQFCWSYYHDMACVQSDPNYSSGGSSLQQFWVYFVLLLFMYLLGLLLGSIYQRFGRTGEVIFFGIAFLFLSVFALMSTYWHWWSAISSWLAPQTAAALGLWLVPLIMCFALASYALLRKAPV
ncbi:MAG TPA: hypothetical protein VFB12_27895 [Ktedonobacteraceae bacterium]|nr:hypothetical protein [Ktedonobacteraceae bacterium]